MSYEYVKFNPNNPDVIAARERCMANIKNFKFAPASNLWAYKILTRRGNGENIPPDSIRMAEWAVK